MIMARRCNKNCRHCGRRPAWASWGLCNHCYDTISVRRLYINRAYPERERGVGFEAPIKLPKPTSVLPGSAKVRVFMERAERGEMLFHPEDAKWGDGTCLE